MSETITAPWDNYDREYRAFQEQEEIPVHRGLYVEDVRTLELGDWERTGGRGAFINLLGMEGMCDIQLHEIPAGDELKFQRHLHGSLVFVAEGDGMSTIGGEDEQTSFEWGEGALFYIPRNTRYNHVNLGSERVFLVVLTSLPPLYSLLMDDDVIWGNNTYDQWSHLQNQDFYATTTELQSGTDMQNRTYWDANFIPDVTSFENFDSWSGRGKGNRSIFFPLRETSLWSHISEFPPGTYKKAHRHVCGANILPLTGKGYTLMWQEGDEERKRIDWGPYSLFSPPTMWYHQHFNLSNEPSRYLGIHGTTYRLGIVGKEGENDAILSWNPSNQIEYHEEDSEIRETFNRELEKRNIENEMSDNIYKESNGNLWEDE